MSILRSIQEQARRLAIANVKYPFGSWRQSLFAHSFQFQETDTCVSEAEQLAAFVLGHHSSLDLYESLWVESEKEFTREQEETLKALVTRRCAGEPIQYITGRQGFWSHDFKVNQNVLIPRADSETLVECALEILKPVDMATLMVLDLGTGSGCLLLSVLNELEGGFGVGLDKSLGALEVAKENANTFGEDMERRTRFLQGDFGELHNQRDLLQCAPFDLILTNPPYIRQHDLTTLSRQVKDYEPTAALVSGVSGLEAYRSIARSVSESKILKPNGHLVVEAGIHQAQEICTIFEQSGFKHLFTRPDLANIDRCVVFSS